MIPFDEFEVFSGAAVLICTRQWPGTAAGSNVTTIPFDLLTLCPAKVPEYINPTSPANPPIRYYGNNPGALAEGRFVVHYFIDANPIVRTGAATDPFVTLYFLTGELLPAPSVTPQLEFVEKVVPMIGGWPSLNFGEGYALQGAGQSGSFPINSRYLQVVLASRGTAPTAFVCTVSVRSL